MKKYFIFIVISIFYCACDNTSSDNLPVPGEVQMIPKSSDLAAIERGIDADHEKDAIIIQWYLLNNFDNSIKEYLVYKRSEDQDFFPPVPDARINVENFSSFDTVFSYIDEDVVLDKYYFYYVTAVNRDDKEGPVPAPEQIVSYQLLDKSLTQDINNGNTTIADTSDLLFRWRFQTAVVPNFYIIRIEKEFPRAFFWAKQFEVTDYQNDQSLEVPNDSLPALFTGSYLWRIDVVGPNPQRSGSESPWKTFFVEE